MKHEESNLQMQCVKWFRAQYPQYAMLLTHPINEGSGHTSRDRMRQGIHKAEGAQAGVPDLLFFMNAEYKKPMPDYSMAWILPYNGLGIEFKTAKGKQSQEQKDFQKMFEAAGYKYIIVRSLEEFQQEMNEYMSHIGPVIAKLVTDTYKGITKAAEEREKEKFYKIIGKK